LQLSVHADHLGEAVPSDELIPGVFERRQQAERSVERVPPIAGRLELIGVTHREQRRPELVRRLVAEPKIPYFKWRHLICFDPTEIDNWLRQSRRPAVG